MFIAKLLPQDGTELTALSARAAHVQSEFRYERYTLPRSAIKLDGRYIIGASAYGNGQSVHGLESDSQLHITDLTPAPAAAFQAGQ